MKKLFSLIAVLSLLMFGASNLKAQEEEMVEAPDSTMVDSSADAVGMDEATSETMDEMPVEGAEETFHQQIKGIFIEGGAVFMSFVLICLILGLALVIERIIYLNMATTNTDKLLARIEEALNSGGVEAAKEVCRDTRGPVASIFYQGLDRSSEGIDMVEKSVISYGSVQMGLLERNLSWISLFIAIAPMLGFMGTVIGMIDAFNSIELAGDVSASLVAGGIKVALITTVGGLIVAIILQVFYNYLLSKIDSLVNNMEDASISMVDLLVKYNLKNN